MGEAKRVLEQAIEHWNAGDREAWATLYAEDVVYEAPGGQRIVGLADLEEKYFDALLTAAPDRVVETSSWLRTASMWWSRRVTSVRTPVRCGLRMELRFHQRGSSSTFPL